MQRSDHVFLDRAEHSFAASGGRRLRAAAGAVPPTGFVLLSIISVQLGAAIAKNLFSTLGPSGTVFLRVGIGALVLLVAWRPRLTGHPRRAYGVAVLFGLALAVMNYAFYSALDRIPLGVAVTLEFVGPLGVAVAGSRRPLDFLWGLLAASGILLLAPWSGAPLDPLGVALALLAGVLWATYIILGGRIGRLFPDGTGLALAMTVGAVVLAPVGLLGAGAALLNLPALLAGVGVALLSAVIPYSLEIKALRRMPAHVFGVLMSVEPAVAAIVGFTILGEHLAPRSLTAIVLVTIAAIGSARFARHGTG